MWFTIYNVINNYIAAIVNSTAMNIGLHLVFSVLISLRGTVLNIRILICVVDRIKDKGRQRKPGNKSKRMRTKVSSSMEALPICQLK